MTQPKKIVNFSIENIKAADSGSKDFDFFSFEYFARDIEHLKQSHRHEFYTLILIIAGAGCHTIDFHDYQLLPNRIFLINYGQVHSWKKLQNVKGYVVLFTKAYYNLIFTGSDKIKSDKVFERHHPFIDLKPYEINDWVSLMKIMEVEFLKARFNHQEIICMLLKIMIVKFKRNQIYTVKNQNKSDRKSDIVDSYQNLINEYYKEWKLPKLYAQMLFITPNHLNSLCKKVVGTNATELIKDRVILEAKRLLTHTTMTVTQIAYELGFEDNSHFGKYFKSVVNETPEKFRTQFNNN
ncbi:MAG: helix-turn-helix transcriptional regulator [Chitinophagaceae bacterium]